MTTETKINLDRLIFIPIESNVRKNDRPSYVILDIYSQEVFGVTSTYGYGSNQYIANATIDRVAYHGSGDTAEESIKNLHNANSNRMLHDNRIRFGKFLEYLKEIEGLIKIKGE